MLEFYLLTSIPAFIFWIVSAYKEARSGRIDSDLITFTLLSLIPILGGVLLVVALCLFLGSVEADRHLVDKNK